MTNNKVSYADRIKKIKMQLDSFASSELYITLAKLHVAPVRSPIRKTNVILKNPNFRKAEELWNYIQSFTSKDKKEFDKKDYFDNGSLKEDYDHAALMTYIANRVISNRSINQESNSKIISEMIERLIENILDADNEITEDRIKEKFEKQIQSIKSRNKAKAKSIMHILEDRLDREIHRINREMEILRSED